MKMKIEKFISRAEFAKLRRVSRKTVTVWRQRGYVVLAANGLIDVSTTNALLDARLPVYRGGVAKPNPNAKSASRRQSVPCAKGVWTLAEAQRRKENAAARLRQLDYERLVAQYVPASDAIVALKVIRETIRERLMRIGGDAAPRLLNQRSAEEVKRIIDEVVHRALSDLSSRPPPAIAR